MIEHVSLMMDPPSLVRKIYTYGLQEKKVINSIMKKSNPVHVRILKFLSSLLILIITDAVAQAQTPILRLETGMHTSTSRRIATDEKGKYILTCSDDKTARLWDAKNGTLLNTYRIPITADEGKLYACSISPNAEMIAVGGETDFENEGVYSVYILKTQTGEIIRNIKGLPDLINDLEFSPNGEWLAIALGGKNGVHIYETQKWNLVKILTGYEEAVYSIAFHPMNNGLASVSVDGRLRIYNKDFEYITETDCGADNRPISVSYNNDGSLLAVGYDMSPHVDVRNATDLSIQWNPSILNAQSLANKIEKLCFNKTGNKLFGAGNMIEEIEKKENNKIRIWEENGKGNYEDKTFFRSSINDLKPVLSNKIALTGNYPELAVVNENGTIQWHKYANKNDFSSSDQSHFKVNQNGTEIGFTDYTEQPLTFNVLNRKITLQNSLPYLLSPTLNRNGTFVSNLSRVDKLPFINGISLNDVFADGEKSISADINSNGESVCIGTDWALHAISKNGNILWAKYTPASVLAVNISGNDKLVTVALADGTVRWYSMADGSELLAFYLDADKERWILFTPSGYYDASPGAEDFLGWHINNGPDKAPGFYPVSRFRKEYFRPDIIDKVLETGDEQRAISVVKQSAGNNAQKTDITKKLPPSVSITYPQNGSEILNDDLTVNFSVNTAADAPAKDFIVLVDGKHINTEGKINEKSPDFYSLKISLANHEPHKECTIALFVKNKFGVSPENIIHLNYNPAQATQNSTVKKPRLFLLAIGISKYETVKQLEFADNDASSMISFFKKQKGIFYEDVQVMELINTQATRENISKGFEWLRDQCGRENTDPNDIAMIFYAGHGSVERNNFYFVPVNGNFESVFSSCVDASSLQQIIPDIKCNVITFLDACYSSRAYSLNKNLAANFFSSQENGIITLTSSRPSEVSKESSSLQHGFFTQAIIEGLDGKAMAADQRNISIDDLAKYVTKRVKELSNNTQNPGKSIPNLIGELFIAAPVK